MKKGSTIRRASVALMVDRNVVEGPLEWAAIQQRAPALTLAWPEGVSVERVMLKAAPARIVRMPRGRQVLPPPM